LAEELRLGECVTFHGKKTQPEMEHVLEHAWVQAVPSVWEEPFGMVAAEAAMRGTAAVVSGAGGLVEIVIHGKTGLHAAGGPEPLAEALKMFLANRALAEQMGAAARLDAQARFSIARQGKRFVELYEGVSNAKAGRA
jgi:glycosyltransferase involved in cell wall biosynthesis